MLEGKKVRSWHLLGLSQEAGRKFFSFSAFDDEWQVIIDHYAGNPLALKIVAAQIQDVFPTITATQSVKRLKQGSLVFDSIHDLLQGQFDRISDLEQEVMYWLAIAHEPISFEELHADLVWSKSKQKLMVVLSSLRKRSLIEITHIGEFTQQPVVMEYVSERFIEQICQEIREWEKSYELSPMTQNYPTPLLQTHALIKATAKDYVRETQIRLILKPVAEYIETQSIISLLSSLRRQSFPKPGYATGNILNLLCQLQVDLTGYDFSHLTIWQAYLRSVKLHRVNFANADLAKSVFAEVFSSVLCVAFSPDGENIAISGTLGGIYQWRVADGRQILAFEGHNGWCFSLAFSPDGHFLASGGVDRMLKLWDAKTGRCVRSLQAHTRGISTVKFSPKGHLLASAGADQVIRLTDAHTGECLGILPGHDNIVRSIAFSPDDQDGQILASCSMDQTLKLWNVDTGKCLRTFEGHTAPVHSIAYSPDGQRLASAGDDHTVKLWDISTGECLRTFEGHTAAVYSIAYSPDSQMLASAGDDTTIKLWDVSTGQCLRTLQGDNSRIWSVAFSPDSQTFVSGSAERTLRFWDVKTGQCLRKLHGYYNWVYPFAFRADGQTLFSNDSDGQLRLWDLETGQCYRKIG